MPEVELVVRLSLCRGLMGMGVAIHDARGARGAHFHYRRCVDVAEFESKSLG